LRFLVRDPRTQSPHEILPICHIPSINPPRVGANASDFTDAAGRKGELPGTSIEGGDAFHLKKGDVIIVPKGTPHQYTEVSRSSDYFVVKATSSQGG